MSSIAIAVSLLLSTAGPSAQDPYETFARGVERGVEEGRPDALPLDVDALGGRVTAGVPAPEGLKAGVLAGMRKSGADRSLGKQLAESVRGGGSVRLLRVRPEKGEGRALFRVLGSSGVNYLDLYLQRAGSGKVRVVDCYVFLSGETLSQTMRRMYLLAVSEADMSLAWRSAT